MAAKLKYFSETDYKICSVVPETIGDFATMNPLCYSASAHQEFLGLPRSLRFLPAASGEKKLTDKLFRTGSVSHALSEMSRVPYSQSASVGRSNQARQLPYRLDFSFLSKA
jgi:hypothetical protein